ncbi:uncharacterized protein CC84DRAFT_1090252 [Paraphaeosphaeria sporulosa]|uniref:PXA domain-containing protein n=1 Tax=Paraphaeosphaeria sporulosa TaxID=1460663 RepID=A0A177CG83_9PLEO|nr:uncharacterized protein CC84DRAFT_1090252 [Paraphaeosphaeria sporulosa]OAG06241.1 hypothetical protein CC84DRAFT_1090252 [Paraphaeosphaeria sporulosa]
MTSSAAPELELPHPPQATHSVASVSQEKELSDKATETTSDKATAAFIRRVLCSHDVLLGNGERGRNTPRPIEDVLPPLSSSNEVDLQLYGIIAVIIKEFVQTWYSKITPDHVFVNEVIQIIAHCTRALEQRLRDVDLEALLLDEIPGLLEEHLSGIRLANQQASSQHSLVTDPRVVYHALHPHPALFPVPTDAIPSSIAEQRESESAWRQLLIQGVLAVLLPTEDLENGCLRALVAEIFAEMILGNGISGKACEGWLLWEGITRIAEVLQHPGAKEEDSQSHDSLEQPLSRLERYGLLAPPVAEHDGSSHMPLGNTNNYQNAPIPANGLFWMIIQYMFLAGTALRAAIGMIATSSSLPLRSAIATGGQSAVEADHQTPLAESGNRAETQLLTSKRPIVSMKLWSCASQLVELDTRMPWLSGFISMIRWGVLAGPGRLANTNGILDR